MASFVLVFFAFCFEVSSGLTALGVDLGTSGVRVAVVSEEGEVLGEASRAWSDSDGRKPATWLRALGETLKECPFASTASRIAVSGTSSSVLAVDEDGAVSRTVRMYDEAMDDDAMRLIEKHAPLGHTTRSRTSALAKMLAYHKERPLVKERLAHQADYVAGCLCCSSFDDLVILSDWHNALKLGFDVETLDWPKWITDGIFEDIDADASMLLPRCLEPGAPSPKRVVSNEAATRWGLKEGAEVVGGTTDSIAAFLACSYSRDDDLKAGRAVTSLGSTTALKLLSHTKVDDAERGVYSHRLDDKWLVGGASNVGCKILRRFNFDDDELERLSTDDLFDHYDTDPFGVAYPLCDTGERFPTNDPHLEPKLPPDDGDRRLLLRRLLVGIANVEASGYKALADLGATPLEAVSTAGGGAKNLVWRRFRSHLMNDVPVVGATHTDAAFGAAVLALRDK